VRVTQVHFRFWSRTWCLFFRSIFVCFLPLAHSFIYFDQLPRYVQEKALEHWSSVTWECYMNIHCRLGGKVCICCYEQVNFLAFFSINNKAAGIVSRAKWYIWYTRFNQIFYMLCTNICQRLHCPRFMKFTIVFHVKKVFFDLSKPTVRWRMANKQHFCQIYLDCQLHHALQWQCIALRITNKGNHLLTWAVLYLRFSAINDTCTTKSDSITWTDFKEWKFL
jgi:hypothetical protein